MTYAARMGNPAPRIVVEPADGDIFLGVLPARLSATDRDALTLPLQGKDSDSFRLLSIGKNLIVAGNSSRAVLFGVYEYLESHGVRWYFPGTDNEVVPQTILRTAGYDATRVPSFRKRGMVVFTHNVLWTISERNHQLTGFREFVAFAARKKINTIAIHHEHSFEQAAAVIREHGLTAEHEIHYFGERFCPDDTRALTHERERMDKYLAQASPGMKRFFLWPDDKNLPPCASEKYKDWRISDLTMNFSNEMARQVRKTRPEGEFAFISYLRTWTPPVLAKPGPGVILEWAPMNQSLAHSLDDPRSAVNRRLRGQFEAYLKLFRPQDTHVLGYWLDDTLFNRIGYGNVPYRPGALTSDLRFYHRAGVPDVTTFGLFAYWDTFFSKAPPAMFLYPQLLWNIDSDVARTMKEFASRYFGRPEVGAVFEALETLDGIVYIDDHKLVVSKERLPEFGSILRNSTQTVQSLLAREDDPIRRSRLAKLSIEVASRANYRQR